MAMKTKLIAFVIAICTSSLASAECIDVACTNEKVQGLEVNLGGVVWVLTTGVETSLSCVPNAGRFLKLETSTQGGKNIYAALLAYQMADKPLTFRVEQGSNPCRILYVNTAS